VIGDGLVEALESVDEYRFELSFGNWPYSDYVLGRFPFFARNLHGFVVGYSW